MDSHTHSEQNDKKEFFKHIVLLALVAIAGYSIYNTFKPFVKKLPVAETVQPTATISTDSYYGVFLDNNEVYFGKLSNKESTFVTLEDSFYIRVTQTSQKGKDGKEVSVPNMDLVKVGTEFHKPKDKIEIQRSHIISIQELSPDSDVIKAINNYKSTPHQ